MSGRRQWQREHLWSGGTPAVTRTGTGTRRNRAVGFWGSLGRILAVFFSVGGVNSGGGAWRFVWIISAPRPLSPSRFFPSVRREKDAFSRVDLFDFMLRQFFHV